MIEKHCYETRANGTSRSIIVIETTGEKSRENRQNNRTIHKIRGTLFENVRYAYLRRFRGSIRDTITFPENRLYLNKYIRAICSAVYRTRPTPSVIRARREIRCVVDGVFVSAPRRVGNVPRDILYPPKTGRERATHFAAVWTHQRIYTIRTLVGIFLECFYPFKRNEQVNRLLSTLSLYRRG